eukprot:scaffold66819_cov45-Phaeocystis_antarctica.AAC.1
MRNCTWVGVRVRVRRDAELHVRVVQPPAELDRRLDLGLSDVPHLVGVSGQLARVKVRGQWEGSVVSGRGQWSGSGSVVGVSVSVSVSVVVRVSGQGQWSGSVVG